MNEKWRKSYFKAKLEENDVKRVRNQTGKGPHTYKSSVTANFNITKNINQISSQLQKSNTEESLQLANQQSQHFELETSNRFTQLSDDKNSDTDAVTEPDTSSRKALLIGNSHVKRIRTGNFIQNCLVHKYIEHSCEGMMDKIEELDTDYECILLHVFTNNIRDDTVEECVQKTEELIDALRRHCQFAKIIISLPFLTIQDKALNNKIEECNILLQYKFLKHVYVTISNNSRLSSGNVPIKKFYGVDGLHLSNQGVSVFVAGIKFHMKNILQVTETLKMRQQASKPERGPKQNRHERSFSNQTHNLNSIITEAADISLKLKRPKKKNPKHLNKIRQPKWFDISLTGLRRQLDSKEKLLKKFSKDPIVRTSYFSLLKLYRKTRKQKLKEFRRSVMDELDNLHENNPNKYWNLLKDLSKDTNKSTSPDIPCNTWFDYFKELNKSKINTTDNNFINRFKQLEKKKYSQSLTSKLMIKK
ncbi:unnamed protein product [Mytilus edulis]|uniref:Uncharacterized protein n=1 Tax=Mytilus edulis TaxID=6550 RepID=A0A8S3VBS8_MYTED|nr:unnamed protein product [Mytilus edulis]